MGSSLHLPRVAKQCRHGCRHQPRCSVGGHFGRTTVSITWMTPFEHAMSVLTTLAPSMLTAPSFTLMDNDWPLTVFALSRPMTSFDRTLPATTWYLRMLASFS